LISRFLGIVIRMYFLDHDPPHFHASYGGVVARVAIVPPVLLNGKLPPRVLALIFEWAKLHQAELLDNWHRLHSDRPPYRIDPLE